MTNKMITQTKPKAIYEAFSDAIDNYCKRHYLTYDLFAEHIDLDGGGDSLSSLLNLDTTKLITHEQEHNILDKLDAQARKVYFEARVKQWEMDICKEPSSLTKVDISLGDLADDAMIESSESFTSVKIALEDGHLSKIEAEKIIKESNEALRCHQNIIDCAKQHLKEMGQEE